MLRYLILNLPQAGSHVVAAMTVREHAVRTSYLLATSEIVPPNRYIPESKDYVLPHPYRDAFPVHLEIIRHYPDGRFQLRITNLGRQLCPENHKRYYNQIMMVVRTDAFVRCSTITSSNVIETATTPMHASDQALFFSGIELHSNTRY